jgi:8-oxo-dGTP pyrophosphatase MutT (NUDIX family)
MMMRSMTQKESPKESPNFVDWAGTPVHRMPDVLLPSACAVIFDGQGRLLLQQRADNGHWGLPGGRMDAGESIEATAVRETLEETGFIVHTRRLIGVYSDPSSYSISSYPNGRLVQYLNLSFECEIIGGEMMLSEESTDIGFFDVNALPEPILLSHKLRIADALAGKNSVFVR